MDAAPEVLSERARGCGGALGSRQQRYQVWEYGVAGFGGWPATGLVVPGTPPEPGPVTAEAA
ncbi:hypothetical protein [Saccharothrix sp. HUAS TT1]|uniref:hypothetical protein n=1 Tax=unclassified Saccharothrix TaxID=2593673 RepID=UPI00345B6964